MKEFVSSVSPKGQITLPAEARAKLGLRPRDKVSITIEDERVVVRPAAANLEAGFQSIPALPRKLSLDEMTETAAEENAGEAAREGIWR